MRLRIIFWIACGLLVSDSVSPAQTFTDLIPPPSLFVEFSPNVRSFLRTEWNLHAKNPQQSERGYCGKFQNMVDEDDNNEPFYYVNELVKPIWRFPADPFSIRLYCPKGTIPIHTHPATTCKTKTLLGIEVTDYSSCILGGGLAYQCQPSKQDRRLLRDEWLHENVLFAVVQCDSNSLVPYFPVL